MLTLDKKLNCIEAPASEVLAVYQSEVPVNVAPADHKAELCEAFICVINKNDLPNIFVALATKSKKVIVYKPSSQPVAADFEQTLQESIDFVKGMGFTMESVDLNYSAAMKTVVVGNIKVLRSPGTAARAVMKNRTADAALLKGDKLDKSPQPVEAIEGRAPAAVLSVAPGRVATGRDNELAALRAELKHLSGERTNAEQAAASKLVPLKGKLKQMEEEKNTLARTLGKELAAVRAELARLVAEKARGEANRENALTAHSGEVAELAVARDAALLREQELSALQRITAEELAKTRAELERVVTDLSATTEVATAQAEKSRLMDAELSELRIEQARLVTELAIAALREQGLTTEKVALAGELATTRVNMAELVAAQEKERAAAREVLAAELTPMPEEVAELSMEGPLPASQDDNSEKGAAKETVPWGLAQATQKWTAEDYFRPLEDDAVPGNGFIGADVLDNFPLLGEEQAFPNPAADDDVSPVASFVLGTGVSAIEYVAAEDILELYTSINVVRISPEGGKPQNGKAYICSVGKEGAAQVFVGLYLMESCRTLVYLQDQPPVGEVAYGRAISKAMEFTETVGFMMGPVALAADPVQRGDFLGRLPVLKLAKNVQG